MVGEHIRILRDGRWIHAIDCGDETVLHLAEDAPPPRVRRAYRPEFVAGAAAVEIVTHRERTFPARDIVKRAYSRASDPALAAMFHDSEAFAEWCTTGRLTASRTVALELPPAPAPAPALAPAAKPAARRADRPVARPARAAKARPAERAKPGPKAKAKLAPQAKRGRAKAKPVARRAAAVTVKRKPARAKPARRPAKLVRRPARPSPRKARR